MENIPVTENYTYSYSTATPGQNYVVTKEAIAEYSTRLEDSHRALKRVRRALEAERGQIHWLVTEEQISDWLSHEEADSCWIRCYASLNVTAKQATLNAFTACKNKNLKFLFYWCSDPSPRRPQVETHNMLVTLLLQAMRLYSKDMNIQPKPSACGYLRFDDLFGERPISFHKMATVLFEMLDDINGPIVCIISGFGYLMEGGGAAEDHRKFLYKFFKNLGKKVRLCVSTSLELDENLEPLSFLETKAAYMDVIESITS